MLLASATFTIEADEAAMQRRLQSNIALKPLGASAEHSPGGSGSKTDVEDAWSDPRIYNPGTI